MGGGEEVEGGGGRQGSRRGEPPAPQKEPQAELMTVYSSSHDQGHCW